MTLATEIAGRMQLFVDYVRANIRGDEKGEAQIYLDRFFQAFGHAGSREAGAVPETRIKRQDRGTAFADLVWRPRVLIEMKKRGELLAKHYHQARDYWWAMQDKTRYLMLCNFDEFVVYDMNHDLTEPADRIPLDKLPERFMALAFLFPIERAPQFKANAIEVTDAAATKVATVFRSMVARGVPRADAQRFALQAVAALFSEDVGLLPGGLFTEILNDCRGGTSTTGEAICQGLFRQMNDQRPGRQFV
jgi:hypothetical protein